MNQLKWKFILKGMTGWVRETSQASLANLPDYLLSNFSHSLSWAKESWNARIRF